jgi:hypothetical protein
MVAFQPFAASAMTWNGRLTLGVRLHPVLSTDKALSQKIVEGWKASLQRLPDGASLTRPDERPPIADAHGAGL